MENIPVHTVSECIHVWGGYVIVTLMKKKFVDEYHWIGEDEMLDSGGDCPVLARCDRSQRSHRGRYKLLGIPGALVAILGTILPPFVIIAAISVCYNVFRSNFFVAQMLSGDAGRSGSGDRFRDV